MAFLPLLFLFLTFRTPEGRAAILGEAPDDAGAVRGPASLAFAVVDLEGMLEVAEFTRGLTVIPQG
jgi:hypothetical protein